MKVGVCVMYNSISEMEEKFQALRAEGFDNCQIVAWRPAEWTDENAAIINDLLKKYDIEISAFWCGWGDGDINVWNFYEGPTTLGLLPPEYRAGRIKDLCNGADFAKKLGVKNVATHMGFIPENPNDPEFLPFCDAVRVVAEHLQKNGQNLLFETGQETPVAMMRCFEVVGTDNLGVNLDTANLILYGKANPVDALDVFGHKVMNLHAKDGKYPVNGHDLGEEVSIGMGKVDFHGVISKLHELGYDGYVTIEREVSNGKEMEDEERTKDIRFAKQYLENIISKVCGGATC